MTIDRCICHGRLFTELHEAAVRSGAGTVEELRALEDFGRGCQLCHPYVRRMLKTGETVFHEVIREPDPPQQIDDGPAATSAATARSAGDAD